MTTAICPALPSPATLTEISRCLAWLARPGVWDEWLATLPGSVADEMRLAASTPAAGAREQAEAIRTGTPIKDNPRRKAA